MTQCQTVNVVTAAPLSTASVPEDNPHSAPPQAGTDSKDLTALYGQHD